jgi:hypothetical protein
MQVCTGNLSYDTHHALHKSKISSKWKQCVKKSYKYRRKYKNTKNYNIFAHNIHNSLYTADNLMCSCLTLEILRQNKSSVYFSIFLKLVQTEPHHTSHLWTCMVLHDTLLNTLMPAKHLLSWKPEKFAGSLWRWYLCLVSILCTDELVGNLS